MGAAVRWTAVVRRLLGGEIDHATRPLVVTVLIGSMARSVMISFTGIWAIQVLTASDRQLGIAYAIAGVAAAIAGYVSGRLADRAGGRGVLLIGWSVQAVIFAGFAGVGRSILLGLVLIVITTAVATFCATASQTVVTELVPPDRHTLGFAALRLGQNLGYAAGPPLGSLLLTLGWSMVFAAVAVIATAAAATVFVKIPKRRVASEPYRSCERPSIRSIITDKGFLRLYVASCLAMVVYSAAAVLLPVSLTQSHGVSPQAWGLLAIINPVLIIVLQLRIADRLREVKLPTQVATAVALMGGPFLLLPTSSALIVVAIVLIFYTVGEVIWAPAAQSLVTGHAPAGQQGAYLGAFASTLPIGLAVGPMIGFQVRAAWGDTTMWLVNGVITVLAAAMYRWRRSTTRDAAEVPPSEDLSGVRIRG